MNTHFAKASRVKYGKVLLIGRPNVGKSTFLNNVIGQKVAITSPKPQTTRFPIRAILQEERGSIVFVDTPGIFGKAEDALSKKINQKTIDTIREEINLVIYMIDPTRNRDFEEAKVLGIVRKINKPKILVMNKFDEDEVEPKFLPQYAFLQDEFNNVYKISALNRKHVKPLIEKMFEYMPESSPKNNASQDEEKHSYPLLNLDSKTFIAELIREKVFLMMGEEIPYTTTIIVEEIKERDKNLTYIKAKILTINDRYKKMLIGEGGRKIKEIGSYAKKEIALAIDKKVYLDLTVVTDPHWVETYY